MNVIRLNKIPVDPDLPFVYWRKYFEQGYFFKLIGGMPYMVRVVR